MNRALYAALGLIATGAVATSALADGHIENAVKARKGLMQVAAFYLGPLGAMAKGEMEYDADIASSSAKNLATVAAMDTGAMWPAGSDNGAFEKTRALPAAWASDSQVMAKHEDWIKATADLAAIAGDGLDAMRPAVAAVGKSCGGCHDDYRAEKK